MAASSSIPSAADIPVVTLYKDHATITVQVPNDSVISYVTDPSRIWTSNSTGNECAVIMTPVKPTPAVLDVTPAASPSSPVVRGSLIAMTDKIVTVESVDGGSQKRTIRYSEVTEVIPAVEVEPDSYMISYQGDDSSNLLPKTTYYTNALFWTPVLRLEVAQRRRGSSSLLTLSAIVTSRMKESFNADYSVIAYEEEGSDAFSSRRSFAATSADAASSRPAPGVGQFDYHISKFDLFGIARVPIMERRVHIKKVYFIKLGPGQSSEDRDTAATIGYVFDTSFPFPSCFIDIVDDTYQTRKLMPAKTSSSTVFVKTHKSNSVSYRATVSEVTTPAAAGTGPSQTTVTVNLTIRPDKLADTVVSISYEIGDVRVIKASPKAASDFFTPGRINWREDVQGGREHHTVLTFTYER